MKKILKVIGAILATLVIVPIGLGLILKGTAAEEPPAGEMVDVGGHSLHINCSGPDNDLPTIIIESGAATPSVVYHWLQDNLSKTTKVCSYDRAGLAWSEASAVAHDADNITSQLHALLDGAKIKRPFVFAGHSIAGIHMRVFVERYPDEVAGIAFLDASHPDQVKALGIEDLGVESLETQIKVFKVLLNLGLTYLYNPLTADSPVDSYPDKVTAQLEYFANSRANLNGSVAEMTDIPQAMDQARKTGVFGDLPIVVVSAGEPLAEGSLPPPLDPVVFKQAWITLQKDIASLSSNSKHIIMPNANHMSMVANKVNADEAAGYVRDLLMRSAEHKLGAR